jgi:hypothetical protein
VLVEILTPQLGSGVAVVEDPNTSLAKPLGNSLYVVAILASELC